MRWADREPHGMASPVKVGAPDPEGTLRNLDLLCDSLHPRPSAQLPNPVEPARDRLPWGPGVF